MTQLASPFFLLRQAEARVSGTRALHLPTPWIWKGGKWSIFSNSESIRTIGGKLHRADPPPKATASAGLLNGAGLIPPQKENGTFYKARRGLAKQAGLLVILFPNSRRRQATVCVEGSSSLQRSKRCLGCQSGQKWNQPVAIINRERCSLNSSSWTKKWSSVASFLFVFLLHSG